MSAAAQVYDLEKYQAWRWAQMSPQQIQGHIQRQFREAQVPALFRPTRFATLEAAPNTEAMAVCQRYAQDGAYEGKPALLLLGRPGTGKTSLAVAILRHTVEQTQGRYGVLFWNVSRGLEEIRQSFGLPPDERRSILELTHNRLLVLDDLGKQQLTGWVAEQFYSLLDALWTDHKQVVITTNVPMEKLVTVLDEAVVSRLLEMCYPLALQGPDRRVLRAIPLRPG